jgi:hypothetical protein
MRRFVVWVSSVAGVLYLLACMGIGLPIELVAFTLFGWIWYLARTLPEVKLTSDGVVTAGICLVLVGVGSHFFLAWLYRESRNPARAGMPRTDRWKWRWTFDLVVVTVLMFVAGMSVTGVAHQLGWLMSSKDPWVVSGSSGAMARAQSTNNLKQMWLALNAYHQAHDTFPPGGTFDREGRALQSWQALIMPYLEDDGLHDRIDFSIPWHDPRNAPAFRTKILAYLHPNIPEREDAAGYALSHYAANVYMLGGDHPHAITDVSDGTGRSQGMGRPDQLERSATWFEPEPRGVRQPLSGRCEFHVR